LANASAELPELTQLTAASAELTQLAESTAELAKLATNLAELPTKLAELPAELAKLTTDLTDLSAELTNLSANLADLATDLTHLAPQLAYLAAKLCSAKLLLEKLEVLSESGLAREANTRVVVRWKRHVRGHEAAKALGLWSGKWHGKLYLGAQRLHFAAKEHGDCQRRHFRRITHIEAFP
jgi:septal ring factor EnvC (AmiA/AmiB activator)